MPGNETARVGSHHPQPKPIPVSHSDSRLESGNNGHENDIHRIPQQTVDYTISPPPPMDTRTRTITRVPPQRINPNHPTRTTINTNYNEENQSKLYQNRDQYEIKQ
ncbi:unnamed protein product, partial [Trichogramma brassicae]